MKTFLQLVALTLAVNHLAAQTLTRDNGAPVGNNQNSKTAGPDGAVLLDDVHLIQKLQRFDRERIPERVVHARGTGVTRQGLSGERVDGQGGQGEDDELKKWFHRHAEIFNQAGSIYPVR